MPWELHWPKGRPSDDIVAATVADIDECLGGLNKAEDLVFHTVWLGDDYATCPQVTVYGVDGDQRLHCVYDE